MGPFNRSFSFLRIVAVAAPLTLLPLAHAQDVRTDYDHGANFAAYHTFSFAKVQTANPLFQQRIQQQITSDLQARGWQPVPSGGDIAITAIGEVQNEQEYNTFYNGLGPGFGWRGWGGWGGRGWGGGIGDSTTTVQNIPVGTLVIDLYDTNTHNLVFRGMSQQDVHKHADKNVSTVNKAIDKIFKKLPDKRG